MMRMATLAAAIATGAIVGSACLIDLDHRIACGDGYVDRAAGEECDPGDPDSFVNECRDTIRPDGTADCDPTTCEIINDRLQCAFCGDGRLDSDFIDDAMTVRLEECDGDKFAIPSCPSGGQLACTSDCRVDFSRCDLCGNGVLDEGEECDPNADVGGIVSSRTCAGADPLQSPYLDLPFASGVAAICLDDCRYDRSGCSYCGNGAAEDSKQTALSPLQVITMTAPEACDGEYVRDAALVGDFAACFTDPDLDGKSNTTANAECAPGCHELVPRVDAPLCCLKTGEDCPAEGAAARCCHEYTDPEAEQHCSDPFLPPGDDAPPEDGGSKCN
ncbi:MAG: hypothetical protein IAG13_10905 [Deltaproteobacteria bacterium]|nr:hypothetical protein [Nannocystaceae bacterium]